MTRNKPATKATGGGRNVAAAARGRKLSRGDRNIEWIEEWCRVPEGSLVGQPVVLRPWQRRDLRRIYNNRAGTRRAILSFGRKNGKTALAACLLLLHLCGPESVPNGQLYSCAQSRDQAGLLFSLAAKMVRLNPDLDAQSGGFVKIRDAAKQLLCPDLGTIYRALSAEAGTSYGLSPSFIVHDELGQVHGPRSELYEALETATAGQANPLSIIISTQAPTDADLLSVLIDDAIAGHDPRVVCSLYTAPIEANPFRLSTIKKANPAFGDFQNGAEVLAMAGDAERMPSREAEFRNLVLNQRVEASAPYVPRGVWHACRAKPRPLDGVPVYAGLDLSAAQDLTALVLIGKIDRVWQVHPTFWLPADGLAEKGRKDRVPYQLWHERGFLEAAPGRSVDYSFVARRLRQLTQELDVRKIAFDRWGFRHLLPWLLEVGFYESEIDELFVEFGQGFQSMSPALRDLEVEILNRRVAHGDHPVLTMCAANSVVKSDEAGNRKLDKARSRGRIDGMVALTMAFGAAPALDEAIDIEAMVA